MKRKCWNCGNMVDWKVQLLEWMTDYGDDWMDWAYTMIVCYKCGEYVGSFNLEEGGIETEEVSLPEIEGKVRVPTFTHTPAEVKKVN